MYLLRQVKIMILAILNVLYSRKNIGGIFIAKLICRFTILSYVVWIFAPIQQCYLVFRDHVLLWISWTENAQQCFAFTPQNSKRVNKNSKFKIVILIAFSERKLPLDQSAIVESKLELRFKWWAIFGLPIFGTHTVYDRNHYFGFRPIPKPKPKLADTFGRYHNRYRNYILKGESSYR